ncbi:MAG: hypothetical protein ACFCBV_01475 [Phycisphaerales bacterium]
MSTTRTAGGTQLIVPMYGSALCFGPAEPGQFPRVRTPEEVFVSPRVVDRVAFEDYAGALRKLLAAATTEGEHLRRTAVEASKSLRAIGDVLPAVDKKLARAGELVGQLSEKLERVEAAAKRAEAAADRATTAEQRIRDMDERARHRIFEASGSATDEAVARIEDIAQKRADELDDRGVTLNEFVDRGRADLAETRAKAAEAMEKTAGQVKAETANAVEAIKTQRAQAQDAIAEDHQSATHAIDGARGEVVEAISTERLATEQALADRVSRLTMRVDELVDAAEHRLGQVLEEKSQEANERADSVAQRIDSGITPQLEASAAAAEAAMERASEADAKARSVFEIGREEIEKLCERAEAVVEASGAGQANPAENSLAAITKSAAGAMEQMTLTAADGERARRQAEESRKALGESIESAALWLDRLVEQRDSLQQSITLATKLCDQAEGQLAERRAELDEAMRGPATEVQRHVDTLNALAERAEEKREALVELIEQIEGEAETHAGAATERAIHKAKVEAETLDAKVEQAVQALSTLAEQTDSKRVELADAIDQAEKRAETKANAAADKAAEKAIHKAKVESEKLDAKATQARQALEQAWKTLETRLKGELKESLTALSAEGQRAERARKALREDIETARTVEKETRAAVSKPAPASSVEQLIRLASMMQDLATKTAAPKPATSRAAAMPQASVAAPPASKKVAKKTAKKVAKKVAKVEPKRVAPKSVAKKTSKAAAKKTTKKAPVRKKTRG